MATGTRGTPDLRPDLRIMNLSKKFGDFRSGMDEAAGSSWRSAQR